MHLLFLFFASTHVLIEYIFICIYNLLVKCVWFQLSFYKLSLYLINVLKLGLLELDIYLMISRCLSKNIADPNGYS